MIAQRFDDGNRNLTEWHPIRLCESLLYVEVLRLRTASVPVRGALPNRRFIQAADADFTHLSSSAPSAEALGAILNRRLRRLCGKVALFNAKSQGGQKRESPAI